MDGIHDLGGMHGFGAIHREENEPAFHADWERRVFAMVMASGFVTEHGGDQLRNHIERIPPSKYLQSSYYQLWFQSLIEILKEAGAITEKEVETGKALENLPEHMDPQNQAQPVGLESIVKGGFSRKVEETDGLPHRFKTGDRVMTQTAMSYGHTRLPRFARGQVGQITRENGFFIFSDSNAQVAEENPQMLYTVEFKASDLFGCEGRETDVINLDLWDSYLLAT